jgi:hypothetical protein
LFKFIRITLVQLSLLCEAPSPFLLKIEGLPAQLGERRGAAKIYDY